MSKYYIPGPADRFIEGFILGLGCHPLLPSGRLSHSPQDNPQSTVSADEPSSECNNDQCNNDRSPQEKDCCTPVTYPFRTKD